MLLFARAKMSVTGTPGTGTVTLNAAVSPFQTLAAAGVVDGDLVSYLIEEGTSWEVGRAKYTASGTTLARASTTDPMAAFASSSGSAVSFTSAATVSLVELPQDVDGAPYRIANLTTGKYVWSGIQSTATLTTALNSAGIDFAVPFWCEGVFDGIAIEVTTLSAGNVRMALYAADKNGIPSTLIEEVASPPATSSTGIKVGTFAAARRLSGMFWVFVNFSANTTTRNINLVQQASPSRMGASALSGSAFQGFNATRAYAAFPGTAVALTQQTTASWPVTCLRTA